VSPGRLTDRRPASATSLPANNATGEDLEREQRITGAPSTGKFPK
jgi:hypothetical protein